MYKKNNRDDDRKYREEKFADEWLFVFKQKSYDFIVEEILPFKLSWEWDALYVLFEKQNKTTMEVIEFLCKELKISRLTLWVAGLKDKDAITQQWISIYKSALDKFGWENHFINTLARITKVIKADWHTKPLGMTDHIQNRFFIRLRAKQAISQKVKAEAQTMVEKLFAEGFPNFYGTQRFGINGQNREIGKKIVEWKTSIKDKFEHKFKLQAYASWLFNQYIKERLPLGKTPLAWEIVEDWNIIGPVFGNDTKLAEPNTEAGKFQKKFMETHNINQNFFNVYKKNNIFGLSRSLRVKPINTKIKIQWNDLLLQFILKSWSYASILIYQLMEHINKIKEDRE